MGEGRSRTDHFVEESDHAIVAKQRRFLGGPLGQIGHPEPREKKLDRFEQGVSSPRLEEASLRDSHGRHGIVACPVLLLVPGHQAPHRRVAILVGSGFEVQMEIYTQERERERERRLINHRDVGLSVYGTKKRRRRGH
jgi:hypothetical protein